MGFLFLEQIHEGPPSEPPHYDSDEPKKTELQQQDSQSTQTEGMPSEHRILSGIHPSAWPNVAEDR
jgi:hypothetical protein